MKSLWFGFWIRIAYLLRLRWPFIRLQRWLKEEHKEPWSPLPRFDTPEEMVGYAQASFMYRFDQGRLGGWVFPLDWITDPEVFQARLNNPNVRDGDCDDYHYWAATVLSSMPEVEIVYLLSVGYPGGGHTTCVFKGKYGDWFHLDYILHPIRNPNLAPMAVAKRHTRKGTKPSVSFYVFETIEFKDVAIGPKGKIPHEVIL